MAAELEIRDGTPWWASTDIWVAPGNDPNSAPGQPIAGEPAFVWARVHNNGDSNVEQAQVRFWWANPSAGVLRTTATLIGASAVNLRSGETKDVLCVIPWVPTVVNNGHECLVAEILHPADPLPQPLPEAFQPMVLRQVAQRNMVVLPGAQLHRLAIQVASPTRQGQSLMVKLEQVERLDPE
jgi:hypothetical protein